MDADTTSTGKGPAANLAARRAAGQIRADAVQEKIVQRLQAVHERLAAMAREPGRPTFWSRIGLGAPSRPPEGPRGLYIWGPVGRGKSMLMDLFFADAPVVRKRRVHFHEFMVDVHERIHDWRQRRGEVLQSSPPRGYDSRGPRRR